MRHLSSLLLIWLAAVSFGFGQMEVDHIIEHDGQNRFFRIHLPPNYDSNSAYPLLIYFHNSTQDMPEDTYKDLRFNDIADSAHFIVAYPKALNMRVGDDTQVATWNAYTEVSFDDIGFIDAMLDFTTAQYGIDEDRIYAAGQANGGQMAYRMVCELSHRLAAIGAVATTVRLEQLSNCQPQNPIPIIQFHGTDDQYYPIDGVEGKSYSLDETLHFFIERQHCSDLSEEVELPDISPDDFSDVTLFRYNSCDCNAEINYYRINGGGYSWPGSDDISTTFNPTNQDIDASQLIWDFCAQYSRKDLVNCTTNTSEFAFDQNLFAFPNPSSGQVSFNQALHTVTVHDLAGAVVHQENNATELNLEHLANGLYIIKGISTSGSLQSIKWIKIK